MFDTGRVLGNRSVLMHTTMDQLRTLVAVKESGTALGAARVLGREQSSVQKQLDTLNRNFEALCGEPLLVKQGRGRDVVFTGTGEALVTLARQTLGEWLDQIEECRRRLGGTLVVGTTRFTLGYFTRAGEQVADRFQALGVKLKVEHIRTRDLLDSLRGKQTDLVCGSVVSGPGRDGGLAGFDIMEWRRSGLSLLTNLPAHQLPGSTVGNSALRRLPLVMSDSGLITGFLHGWFGTDYDRELTTVARIDTVTYGLELLSSALVTGCMLVTRGIAEAVSDGVLTEGRGLRVLEVVTDAGPELEVLVGAFTRVGELAGCGPDHPLALLWGALASENERSRLRAANPPGRSTEPGLLAVTGELSRVRGLNFDV